MTPMWFQWEPGRTAAQLPRPGVLHPQSAAFLILYLTQGLEEEPAEDPLFSGQADH